MNRRHFLIVLGGSAVALSAGMPVLAEEPSIGDTFDAGPLENFEQDKVYAQFRDQGVLLIRRGDEVFALSPVCTHKGCKVRAREDQTFICKCHGSRFDADGKVVKGPAVRDLLRLKVKLSAEKHVLVKVEKPRITG